MTEDGKLSHYVSLCHTKKGKVTYFNTFRSIEDSAVKDIKKLQVQKLDLIESLKTLGELLKTDRMSQSLSDTYIKLEREYHGCKWEINQHSKFIRNVKSAAKQVDSIATQLVHSFSSDTRSFEELQKSFKFQLGKYHLSSKGNLIKEEE